MEQFSNDCIKKQRIWEAISLYCHLLSVAEDNSVVIIAVELLSALCKLLESKIDEISQLNGIELVKRKVKKFVTMGIWKYPVDNVEFNWRKDGESAQFVIPNWPTPLVVQSYDTEFLTGAKL